jgi:hypothetical protein
VILPRRVNDLPASKALASLLSSTDTLVLRSS